MPKCRFCKKEIKNTKECYIVAGERRNTYFCNIECYHNQLAKDKYKPSKTTITGDINPRRELTDYILALYVNQGIDKYDIPWQMMMSQLKNIIDNHKEQKYTYQSILYVLKYMNMIGVNLFDERSNGSVLSLVEYYYNEARQYCIDTNRLKRVFEKVELNEEPIIITKNVGKSKLQSKKMDFD